MSISAIIPTWNEATSVAPLVEELQREVDEVWVADSASPDGTAERARRAGANVVICEKGRGVQLIAGTAASRGDQLVFVHADTRIPAGFGAAIREAFEDPEVIGGNFRVGYEPSGRVAQAFSLANDWRRRILNTYYGDSCIFVRRSVYEQIGGFEAHPLFEDFVFARAMERRGRTQYIRHPAVGSSARRFERRPLQTLTRWVLLQAAFSIGVSPQRLSRHYADSQP